jgi:hypothetical protein
MNEIKFGRESDNRRTKSGAPLGQAFEYGWHDSNID